MVGTKDDIYKRFPDWDGRIPSLLAAFYKAEGNSYEVWYNHYDKMWYWLDYYFDFGTKAEAREDAILNGIAASCYWLTSLEEYEREEYERRRTTVETPQENSLTDR